LGVHEQKWHFYQDEDDLPGTVLHAFFILEGAMQSGNVQQIQQAAFAAAVAIGKVIEESLAPIAPPKTEERL
jgi:hypothetical protein